MLVPLSTDYELLVSWSEFIALLVVVPIPIWRLHLYVLVGIWLDDFVVSFLLLVLSWFADDVLLPMVPILHCYLLTLVDDRSLRFHLSTRDHASTILGVTGIGASFRQSRQLRNGNRVIKIDGRGCCHHGSAVIGVCIGRGAHSCVIVDHEVHTV